MPVQDPVAAAARAHEPDRYLAALYAPEPARTLLVALAAFAGDIARIPSTVREPLLVEIRLQWWRDALASAAQGGLTGHPVADRLAPNVATGTLPLGLLSGMIDAAGDPPPQSQWPDAQLLRSHLAKVHGAAFGLAARALGATHSSALEAAVVQAGYAYGLARLLAETRAVPPDLRDLLDGQCRRAHADAASAVAQLDRAVLPGFLPLAMVPVYLDTATHAGDTALAAVIPLRRWWRLWRAQLSGRLA